MKTDGFFELKGAEARKGIVCNEWSGIALSNMI